MEETQKERDKTREERRNNQMEIGRRMRKIWKGGKRGKWSDGKQWYGTGNNGSNAQRGQMTRCHLSHCDVSHYPSWPMTEWSLMYPPSSHQPSCGVREVDLATYMSVYCRSKPHAFILDSKQTVLVLLTHRGSICRTVQDGVKLRRRLGW